MSNNTGILSDAFYYPVKVAINNILQKNNLPVLKAELFTKGKERSLKYYQKEFKTLKIVSRTRSVSAFGRPIN